MDMEKAMDFVLRQQAHTETQLAAIRKLIQTGMRMIVKTQEQVGQLANSHKLLVDSHKELLESHKELLESHKQLAAAQKELARAQKITETKLQEFINSLRRGGNGNSRKN